jgi:fermentation-respiration switch protein FrsA (DUF1100 family)
VRYVARLLAALAVFALSLWVGAVGLLWANETRLVYRASSTRFGADIAPPFVAVRFPSSDGLQLEGVLLERPQAAPAPRWILFFHGAGWSIYRRQQQVQLAALHALGYNIFAVEYRGFGRNDGTPSEDGVYADASAAYRYLTHSRGVAADRIILAGRSLGSAVAVDLATRVPSAGLLLLSAIDSVPMTGARLYPWAPVRLLASSQFDALSKIGRVRVPVLIVHARNDRFVPIAVGRALYAGVTAPKLLVETSGGHNNAGFSPIDDLAAALASLWPAPSRAGDSIPYINVATGTR